MNNLYRLDVNGGNVEKLRDESPLYLSMVNTDERRRKVKSTLREEFTGREVFLQQQITIYNQLPTNLKTLNVEATHPGFFFLQK